MLQQQHNTLILSLNDTDAEAEHVSAAAVTPVRQDAFDIPDSEKIHNIAFHFREIMHILGLDLEDDSLQVHVNNLITAMLAFDEPAFDKILSSMMIRLGFYEAMLQVIYPFLRKTGVLWSTSNTSPAQEHFASNLLRRKMQAALDSLPCPVHTAKKFLLFLPPDEKHELGLLLSDYVIRSKGHTTYYLGQDLPYDSLQFSIASICACIFMPDVKKVSTCVGCIVAIENCRLS